ncbi:uncharacterized protein LOC113217798 [Frankliniella occidentalis]|uniref:Uncharacterized protein LOC113217798 n=1 Tax=Frankliniella occidentalis TaxID=133901 RepID=A0A9C6TQ72_FRAOC|nr:uncharacterized protein LOC113217798 [Frankliniella occidentalis]
MPTISGRVIKWPAVQLLSLAVLAVLMAMVGVAAPARTSGRRLALSWLDPADTEDVPAAVALGGIDVVGGYGGGRAAPRDSGTFDADLDLDLAMDEVSDNVVMAQQEGAEAPLSTAKRTLQDICDNIVVHSRDARSGHKCVRTGLLQCSCDNGYEAVTMGDMHYPHHIQQKKCIKSPFCHQRTYDMPVLTRGRTEMQEGNMNKIPLVPDLLREHWRFEMKQIVVACECGHPDYNGK